MGKKRKHALEKAKSNKKKKAQAVTAVETEVLEEPAEVPEVSDIPEIPEVLQMPEVLERPVTEDDIFQKPKTVWGKNAIIERNPFAQLLGMELLELRKGYAYGRMRMDEHFSNIYGGMHGGCVYALADTLAGIAASTYGNYVTTIDGKMNYLEPVKDVSYVYCEVHVQRQGGRIGVYEVRVTDEIRTLLATGAFTYYRTSREMEPFQTL